MAYQREVAHDDQHGIELEYSISDEDEQEDEADDTGTEPTTTTTQSRGETIRGMIPILQKSGSILT